MKNTPNYYSIIPADVRYDKNLKDKAKLLYSEITALSDKYGYCYASNKYFAELYGVSVTTVSLLIKDLVDNEYLESEIIYKEGTKEILNRYLRIIKGGYLRNLKEGYLRNLKEGYLRKVKDNNTSINNININIKENIKRKVFIKPTIEEIQEYCIERNNGINANAFYDFYESKDWMVGKNKMKDWKACIRTWESRTKKETTPEWFKKDIKREELDENEKQELEELMKEFI